MIVTSELCKEIVLTRSYGRTDISACVCMSPCRSDCIFILLSQDIQRAVSEDIGFARISSTQVRSFLLIVPTRHFVTCDFLQVVRDPREFPAYS